jgi:cation diffusion facilitator CzcD-associated flavoprotein CzcO
MPKGDAGLLRAGRSRSSSAIPVALWLSRFAKYALSELRGPMADPRLGAALEPLQKLSLGHLCDQVHDPALRAKLTPDFQLGCKRVLISDDYWASFERPNVELVTDPIEEITSTGLVTRDGSERGSTRSCSRPDSRWALERAVRDRGPGRADARAAWAHGAVAYQGMTVSGFPNWFILMGPNTGPGHTSVARVHRGPDPARARRDPS